MLEGNTGFTIERELHVKKVKRSLDNWREITLVLNSILLWKKKYYPYVMTAVLLFIVLEFAINSPSFLTTVGLLCLFATLIDYGGPMISSMIWKQDDWNASKEREFEEICRAIATHIIYAKQGWAYLMQVKATRPYLYFMVTISSSLFLAMIGNSLNNFVVFFSLSYFILMLPGLLHHGILSKYYHIILAQLLNILRSFNAVESKPKIQ